MGWYTRGEKRYYFVSERRGGKVHKVYFGAGPVAEFAARAERLRQHEVESDRRQWRHQEQTIKAAVAAFAQLDDGAELLRDAALLAAGFYRPGRHAWRVWNDGRRALERE